MWRPCPGIRWGRPSWGGAPPRHLVSLGFAPLEPCSLSCHACLPCSWKLDKMPFFPPSVRSITPNGLCHLLPVRNHLNAWHSKHTLSQAKLSPFKRDALTPGRGNGHLLISKGMERQAPEAPPLFSTSSSHTHAVGSVAFEK